MRRGMLVLLVILALALQWTPARADNAYPFVPPQQFSLVCKLVKTVNIDPITGNADSHEHQFFGSKSVALGESVADLQKAGSTCADKRDTASYWVPTLYVNGVRVTATEVATYYNSGGKPSDSLHNLPPGLKFIAGNSHATTRQSTDVVYYNCGEGTTPENSAHRDYIPACPSGAQALKLHVVFPDCLAVDDGGTPLLDSADHQSHGAYSAAGVCPGDHPYAIPRLVQSWRFRASAFPTHHFPKPKDAGGVDDVWLSSDVESGPIAPDLEGVTAHADFFNGWNYPSTATQPGLDALFATCIVAAGACAPIK
jgi:hypothetical protein